MKLCIVTDAWLPQVNGVVTTLINLVKEAERDGWEIMVIHPGLFNSIPAPLYSDVRLCFTFGLKQMIRKFNPDHLHIATEGPLGLAARISFRNKTFTTAYHTQWPLFLKDIANIPEWITWKFVKWFHGNGKVMVPTASVAEELLKRNIGESVVLFGRGVDLKYLKPTIKHKKNNKPVLLYVSRASKEKNIDVFCNLSKYFNAELVFVGDGPYLQELKDKYTDVIFKGKLVGEDLANEYVRADCFVFPSVKDTFGIVMIEAQCLGTPVAAWPVTGPLDVIERGVTGCMDVNLSYAIAGAMKLDRKKCQKFAKNKYSWKSAWLQFKSNLVEHSDNTSEFYINIY